MQLGFIAKLISTIILISPTIAFAGPDEDARDLSRSELSSLKNQGWPAQRCFANMRFVDSIIVEGNDTIFAGDELLTVNGNDVERASTEDIQNIMNSVPPDASIAIDVRRAGERLSINQKCSNIADYQGPYIEALQYAAEKKWYDCIHALDGMPNDPFYLGLRVRCASVARKKDGFLLQKWKDQIAEASVSIGDFAPQKRNEIAASLIKSRIELSPSVYNRLSAQAAKWSGGALWQSLQPDLSVLRDAAERGVRGRLIDPQSAIIEMPYDFIYGSWSPSFSNSRYEGYMTCGTVNAKNRMGGYTGSTYFISVVGDNGVEKFTDMDSGTSEYIRPVDQACEKLTKKLTYVGVSPNGSRNSDDSVGRPSIADELKKLAKLFESGALSEEEYAAAKGRVLSEN